MKQTSHKNNTDWPLLLFLVGTTNVKLYIKLVAIIIYLGYYLYKKWEFRRPASIHWFYWVMPLCGLAGAILHHSFDHKNYLPAYAFGAFIWVLAGIVSYMVYQSVTRLSREKVQSTIKMYFLANAIVSAGELAIMMVESGHIMPYWHWGENMYYGGATGDHIFGITASISITNAMITALGALYFLLSKELKWALLCVITSMLCTSNVTLIFLLTILFLIILFYKDKQVKTYATYIFILASVTYPVLTYDNIEYVGEVYTEDIKYKELTPEQLITLKKITSREWKVFKQEGLTAESFKQKEINYYKVKLDDSFATTFRTDLQYAKYLNRLKEDKTNSTKYPPDVVKELMEGWYGVKFEEMPVSTFHKPIKLYTFLQTGDYLLSSPVNLITGAGTGNFSSKQAIKTTGLELQGKYPAQKLYANRSFMEYHLYSLLYVLGLQASEHSVINMPNSIYNQIAGEYGLAGIILFLILYLGYFWRRRQLVNGGVYIILTSLLFFGFEYWFEMISLTVVFELLLLTVMHKNNHEK